MVSNHPCPSEPTQGQPEGLKSASTALSPCERETTPFCFVLNFALPPGFLNELCSFRSEIQPTTTILLLPDWRAKFLRAETRYLKENIKKIRFPFRVKTIVIISPSVTHPCLLTPQHFPRPPISLYYADLRHLAWRLQKSNLSLWNSSSITVGISYAHSHACRRDADIPVSVEPLASMW